MICSHHRQPSDEVCYVAPKLIGSHGRKLTRDGRQLGRQLIGDGRQLDSNRSHFKRTF